MAFTPETLGVIVQPIGGEGMRFISYRTDDAQASVTATSYFAGASSYGIRVNDLIFVSPLTTTFDPYILVVETVDSAGDGTAVISDEEMLKSVYDPQGIEADAFDRANHTGTQAISTVTGLQTELDGKLDPSDIGTSVQAHDSNLDTLSSGTTTLGTTGLAVLEAEGQDAFWMALWSSFGAVDPTGATSSQAAVEAAVADAYAKGYDLYWPAGTYLTTASIPNFHDVRHSGPGVVKRGVNLWYITPKRTQSNTLWTAAGGSDANDGFSESEPISSVLTAANRLAEWGPAPRGSIFTIKCAAGTRSLGTLVLPPLRGANRVVIEGPVAGHPNVPTAVFTASAPTDSGFVVSGSRYLFRDIKLTGFKSAAGGGIVGSDGSNVYADNVHTDDCTNGIKMGGGGNLYVKGGRYENGTNGITCISNVTFTVGYAATQLSEGTIIGSMTGAGVYAAEASCGHVDFCNITSCSYGLDGVVNARFNATENRFASNTYAARMREGAEWFDNNNTYNANTIIQRHGANSSNLIVHGTATAGPVKAGVNTSIAAHTGTTARTVLATLYTIPAYWFTDTTKKLILRAFGTYDTATGAEFVGLAFGGIHALELQSSGTPSGGTVFRMELEVTPLSITQQRITGLLYQGNSVARNVNTTLGFSTLDDGGVTVDLTAKLNAASDQLTIHLAELYLEG